jgi:hypothetical protein
LNPVRFNNLCKDLDFILSLADAPQIVANHYLHITNTHDKNIEKYQNSIFKAHLLFIYFNFINLAKILISAFRGGQYYEEGVIDNSAVLFVSHLTNNSQIYQSDDTYFGSLPKDLKLNNIESNVALINHTKISNKELHLNNKNKKISKFILSPSLDFLSEIRLYYFQITSFIQLRKIVRRSKLSPRLKNNLFAYHFSPYTLSSIRISQQLSSIVKNNNYKVVITTYEGHSWERVSYNSVRGINSNIKCFGYQHAAIFKYQHAIQRGIRKQFNPDIVFTSGLISEFFLNESVANMGIISCLGSPKYQDKRKLIVTDNIKCCLVAPEGIISECVSLFEFSLIYAKQNKKQKFIWRLHPILNFNNIKKYIKGFDDIPENIIISRKDLDFDINRCDSVLYRGSTVVINAINNGLKPIYYKKNDNELVVDPIHDISSGKNIVCNVQDLYSALHKQVKLQDREKLQEFSQKYYKPLNLHNLLIYMNDY